MAWSDMWKDAWADTRHLGRNAFDDIADSYQDILIRGHLMPNRNISRDIAEWERSPREYPLHNPEKDVENTEIDESYGLEK